MKSYPEEGRRPLKWAPAWIFGGLYGLQTGYSLRGSAENARQVGEKKEIRRTKAKIFTYC